MNKKIKEPKILRTIRIADSNNGRTLMSKIIKDKTIYTRKNKKNYF
jgi:hypothetical protein